MVGTFQTKGMLIAGLGLVFVLGCNSLNKARIRKQESILKQELYIMRLSIDQYIQDKNAAPLNLQDLIRAGYLREIPEDPFTKSSLTWRVTREDGPGSLHQTHPGITDVHSGSDRISTEGTPYSGW